LAAGAGNDVRLAQVDTSRCIAFSLLGDLDEAAEAGQQAMTVSARFEEPAGFLNAVFALGQAHWYRGEIAEGRIVLLQGLGHVRGPLRLQRTGTTGTASVLHLVCLSKTYALAGDAISSEAYAAEARDIAEEIKRPYDLAYARVAEGFHYYMLGDHESAIVAFETGLDICRSSSIALLVSSIARYLGHSYAAMRRPEAANALLAEALAQSEAHGLIAFRVWCELGRGHAALPDRATALQRFTNALALARQHGYRPVEAAASRMLGLLAPRQAGTDQPNAVDHLRHALALAEQFGWQPWADQVKHDLSNFPDSQPVQSVM
jgi:tetratricopeptide (TPR) repeat protein